ncbi:unnamed protein product [Camellia sinensis]
MYQQAVAGISHISFGEEDTVSPKKPTSLPEVAKQRELSGTLQSDLEAKLKKQLSDAKSFVLFTLLAELRLWRVEGMCRKFQRAAKAKLPAGCPP